MENKSLEFLDLSLFHPWLLKRKQNLQNSRDFKFCKINWNHRGIPMPKTKTLYVKCNYVDGKFHMIFLSLTFLYPSYLSCSVTNSSFLYLTSTIYIYIQYFPYLFLQCRMSLEIPFFQAHFFLEYNLFVLEIPTSTR